ncbi:MAG: hypothetical protein HY908_31595 [Myxococcales bacterium]|nr:hypothetical protein [Myxococcales bacterium]
MDRTTSLAARRSAASTRLAVGVALCLLGAACDSEPAKPTRSGTTSTATGRTTSPPTTEQPVPAAPEALDVAKLEQALKCGGKSDVCALLARFKACKDWNPVTPGGDGRWLGRAYVVRQGAVTNDFAALRARTVPQSDVGPGQLPTRIGILAMPEGPTRTQAQKAIDAFLRADVPGSSNDAVRWVKEQGDWPEAYAMRAKNAQVFVAVDNGAFVCEGDGRRLYLARLAASRDGSADGLYAELWPVSW